MRKTAALALVLAVCIYALPWVVGAAPKARFSALTIDNTIYDVRTFGAVVGTGKTTAEKNANAAAIHTAWAVINAAQGGAILIPGVIEVGTNVINFGDNTAHWYRLSVIGMGPDTSKIVSESTTNVIDFVGRNYVDMSGVGFSSSTAQIGLLYGRTATSGSCAGNRLTNVKGTGSFTKAVLVGVAAEVMVARSCDFQNTNATGKAYWSSTTNATIGATSSNGVLTTSSNTDIHFYDTIFTNWLDNSSIVVLENGWQGNFIGCDFSGGDATGVKLVTFTATSATNIFRGPVVFRDGLFEGGGGYQAYFQDSGNATAFYEVVFDGNYFNNYGESTPPTSLARPFGYSDVAKVTLYELTYKNNRINPYIDNSALRLAGTDGSYIEAMSEYGVVTILNGGYINNCFVRAKSIIYEGTAFAVGSVIQVADAVAGTMRTIFGPQPNSDSGVDSLQARGGGIQIAKQAHPPISYLKQIGGIFMADTEFWKPQGVTTDNTPTPVYWDGVRYRGMTPIPATPDNVTAPCSRGTIAFDNAYLYYCVTDNNWRRASFVGW